MPVREKKAKASRLEASMSRSLVSSRLTFAAKPVLLCLVAAEGSSETDWLRRKTDSNHRSLSGRIPLVRLVLPAGGVEEACSEKPPS